MHPLTTLSKGKGYGHVTRNSSQAKHKDNTNTDQQRRKREEQKWAQCQFARAARSYRISLYFPKQVKISPRSVLPQVCPSACMRFDRGLRVLFYSLPAYLLKCLLYFTLPFSGLTTMRPLPCLVLLPVVAIIPNAKNPNNKGRRGQPSSGNESENLRDGRAQNGVLYEVLTRRCTIQVST